MQHVSCTNNTPTNLNMADSNGNGTGGNGSGGNGNGNNDSDDEFLLDDPDEIAAVEGAMEAARQQMEGRLAAGVRGLPE